MWTKIALGVSLIANVVLISVATAHRPVQRVASAKPASGKTTLEEFLAGATPTPPAPTIAVSACKLRLDENNKYWAKLLEEQIVQAELLRQQVSSPSFLEQQMLRAQQDFYSEAAREIRESRFR